MGAKGRVALALMMSCAWPGGCGGTPGVPLPPFFVDAAPTTPDVGPAPDSGATPAPDGTTSKPTTCPVLTGSWAGPLSGTITGLGTVQVSGSIKISLAPAKAPGVYTIVAGEWTTAPRGMPSMTAKQQLGGQVTCGVLNETSTASVLGVETKGTVACTFKDQSGCKGSWSGKATDGSSKGAGTFELRPAR
jgi:hypothetical protein